MPSFTTMKAAGFDQVLGIGARAGPPAASQHRRYVSTRALFHLRKRGKPRMPETP